MVLEQLRKLMSAFASSYGWKRPIEETKRKEFSFALQFIALAFFVMRLTWILQLAKVYIRWRNAPKIDIPPWVNDSYIMGSVLIEGVICFSVAYGFTPLHWSAQVIKWICVWKVSETITHNLYYLMLRPALERNPPHSTYRSFVLSCFGLLDVWFVLSLAWYYLGTTSPKSMDSILTAMYFTSTTFFTVGYGDYVPTGDTSRVMAILTMFASVAMIALVLSRAISLLKPLPHGDSSPKQTLAHICSGK